MTRSAVSRVFQCQCPWRDPRHRSALRRRHRVMESILLRSHVMDIAPILACGPNEGMVILVFTVYGGMGAGALSLGTGVAGVVSVLAGKKKASRWLFSVAMLLALVAGGAF